MIIFRKNLWLKRCLLASLTPASPNGSIDDLAISYRLSSTNKIIDGNQIVHSDIHSNIDGQENGISPTNEEESQLKNNNSMVNYRIKSDLSIKDYLF